MTNRESHKRRTEIFRPILYQRTTQIKILQDHLFQSPSCDPIEFSDPPLPSWALHSRTPRADPESAGTEFSTLARRKRLPLTDTKFQEIHWNCSSCRPWWPSTERIAVGVCRRGRENKSTSLATPSSQCKCKQRVRRISIQSKSRPRVTRILANQFPRATEESISSASMVRYHSIKHIAVDM